MRLHRLEVTAFGPFADTVEVDLDTLSDAGLFLLTDGMKREFGFEGIQALSGCCPEMRELHVNGCFQVSTLALKSIAKGFPKLRQLALALDPSKSEDDLLRLLARADPHNHQRVPFSDCVSLFAAELQWLNAGQGDGEGAARLQ